MLKFAGHGGLKFIRIININIINIIITILVLIIVSIVNRAWLQVFPKVYINIKVFTAFQLVRGSAGR